MQAVINVDGCLVNLTLLKSVELGEISLQHRHDTSKLGSVFSNFPYFIIPPDYICNEMHPRHLDKDTLHSLFSPSSVYTNSFPNILFVCAELQCSKHSKVIYQIKCSKMKMFPLCPAHHQLHWDVVPERGSTETARGPVPLHLPLPAMWLSRQSETQTNSQQYKYDQ